MDIQLKIDLCAMAYGQTEEGNLLITFITKEGERFIVHPLLLFDCDISTMLFYREDKEAVKHVPVYINMIYQYYQK